MESMLKKLHLAGIVSAAVSVVGLLAHPEILNLLPAKVATVVSVSGIVLQAITKGIQQGGTELVPREP
jgi:hypothetical protein